MASEPPIEPEPTLGGDILVRKCADGPWQNRHFLLIGNTLFVTAVPFDPARLATAEQITITRDTIITFEDPDPDQSEAEFIVGPWKARGPRWDAVFWFFALTLCRRCDEKHTPEQFETLHKMGCGLFGDVALVKDSQTGEPFTLKTIQKKSLFTQSRNEESMREVEKELMLVIPNHPFIAGLNFCIQTSDCFYLGLDYPAGGELIQYVSSMNMVALDIATLYTAEIALALDYLHQNHIVVRDLNPEKVFLDKNGHVVLADFGMSKRLKETTGTVCGPLEYQAPEIIKHEQYGFAVDWWALGIILYRMLCGYTPFHHDSDFVVSRRILNEEPMLDVLTPKIAVDLIKGLLQKDPKDRMTFEQIKAHGFFEKFDWERILKKDYTPEWVRDTGDGEPAFFGGSSRSRQHSSQRLVKSRDQSSMYLDAFSFGGSGSVGDVHLEMSSSSEVTGNM